MPHVRFGHFPGFFNIGHDEADANMGVAPSILSPEFFKGREVEHAVVGMSTFSAIKYDPNLW